MMEFYKAALSGALSTPLCSEYKASWRKCGDDKEMLITLAMNQQAIPYVATHAHKGLGLTKSYIKKSFKDYINGHIVYGADGIEGYSYALYVDWDYSNDLVVNTDVASIMWTKDANIVIPETKCPTVYISNKSTVMLDCCGFNSVNIKMFDESKLVITELDENSTVTVFKYSDKASVETDKFCLGKVNEFRKELRL